MTDAKRRLGDAGERYAERLLLQRGWKLLDRKWRRRSGEIDLIADDGEIIVFVEVKTRRGDSHGRAEEAVSPARCARLIELGSIYIEDNPDLAERFWRVDLIAITLDRAGRITRYSHIEDACFEG